jgi:hypothetical protein
MHKTSFGVYKAGCIMSHLTTTLVIVAGSYAVYKLASSLWSLASTLASSLWSYLDGDDIVVVVIMAVVNVGSYAIIKLASGLWSLTSTLASSLWSLASTEER